MTWTIKIPVTPFGKGRPRSMKNGHTYTPAKTRSKEAELKIFIANARPPHFEGALRVTIDCVFAKPKSAPKKRVHPIVKPDPDNIAKLVCDAGNNLIWRDDAQIVDLHIMKSYGYPESVTIIVEEL